MKLIKNILNQVLSSQSVINTSDLQKVFDYFTKVSITFTGTVDFTDATITGLSGFDPSENIEFTGEVTFSDEVDLSGATVTGLPDSRPYRVYTVLLTQFGTDAPMATVLENTLGNTMIWGRDGEGEYYVNFGGTENIFNSNKTALIYDSYRNNVGFPVEKRLVRSFISEPKKIWLSTSDSDGSAREGDVLANRFFEIRVYN